MFFNHSIFFSRGGLPPHTKQRARNISWGWLAGHWSFERSLGGVVDIVLSCLVFSCLVSYCLVLSYVVSSDMNANHPVFTVVAKTATSSRLKSCLPSKEPGGSATASRQRDGFQNSELARILLYCIVLYCIVLCCVLVLMYYEMCSRMTKRASYCRQPHLRKGVQPLLQYAMQ